MGKKILKRERWKKKDRKKNYIRGMKTFFSPQIKVWIFNNNWNQVHYKSLIIIRKCEHSSIIIINTVLITFDTFTFLYCTYYTKHRDVFHFVLNRTIFFFFNNFTNPASSSTAEAFSPFRVFVYHVFIGGGTGGPSRPCTCALTIFRRQIK